MDSQRTDHFKRYLALAILLSACSLASSSAAALNASPSQGGNVTTHYISLDLTLSMIVWQGYYGNLTFNASATNVSFNGLHTEVNATTIGLSRCYASNLFATRSASINWTALAAATPQEVDAYTGISNTSVLSAMGIFTHAKTFSVYGSALLLNATTMNAQSGSYDVGLLKDDADLVFVTKIVQGGIAFDNTSADYQIMLPAPWGVNATYHFFLDPSVNCMTPEIINLSVIPANPHEGQAVSLVVVAMDPNGYPLTVNYSLPFNGSGSWLPGVFDSGNYSVLVTVCNSNNYCAGQTINFSVINVPVCGDATCTNGENCLTCSADCGTCPPGTGNNGGGGGSGSGSSPGGSWATAPSSGATGNAAEALAAQIMQTLRYLEQHPFEGDIFSSEKKELAKQQLEALLAETDALDTALLGTVAGNTRLKEIGSSLENLRSIIPLASDLVRAEELKPLKVVFIDLQGDLTALEDELVDQNTFTDEQWRSYVAVRGDPEGALIIKELLYGLTYLDNSQGEVTVLTITIPKHSMTQTLITMPSDLADRFIAADPLSVAILSKDPFILSFVSYEGNDVMRLQFAGRLEYGDFQEIRFLSKHGVSVKKPLSEQSYETEPFSETPTSQRWPQTAILVALGMFLFGLIIVVLTRRAVVAGAQWRTPYFKIRHPPRRRH